MLVVAAMVAALAIISTTMANPEAHTMGEYNVSFDMGNIEHSVRYEPPIYDKPVDSNEFGIDGNATGIKGNASGIVLNIDCEDNDLMLGVIEFEHMLNLNESNLMQMANAIIPSSTPIDSAYRLVEGKNAAIIRGYDASSKDETYAAVYQKDDFSFVGIISSLPWYEGTRQFLKTVHIERNVINLSD
jgi:hypothetical protein